MARITIEDCIEKVPNRFHLVQMTAIRAKQLKKGARPLVSNDENKEVVVALREIADGLVTAEFPDESASLEAEAASITGEPESGGEESGESAPEAEAPTSEGEAVPSD